MKVYRYVKLNEKIFQHFYNGMENEGRNLINHGLMSPSLSYLNFPYVHSKALANTFPLEKQMTKYFFLSLSDALAWAKSCFHHDKTKQNFIYEYAILELDLPLELLNNYLGLGFYKDSVKVEARLPYEDLYNNLNNTPNDSFNKALYLYNKSYQKPFFYFDREYHSFFKNNSSKNFDLVHYRSNKLYPFLCFPIITDYRILNPYIDSNWLDRISPMLNDIITNRPFSKTTLEEFNQNSNFTNYLSYITEENSETQDLLSNKGYVFERRRSK